MYGIGSIVWAKDVGYDIKGEYVSFKSKMVLIVYEDEDFYYYLNIGKCDENMRTNKRKINSLSITNPKVVYLDCIDKKRLSYANEVLKIEPEEVKRILKDLKYYQEYIDENPLYLEFRKKVFEK